MTEDPGKAGRAASGIPVVPAFDGYRALAILGVVLFHIVQACGTLIAAGDSASAIALWGVLPGGSLTTLFIVSGFVMFLPAAARGGDLGPLSAFAIRRAARLVPAYWLCLVVALLLLAVFSPLPGLQTPGAGQTLTHFALLQTPALLVDGPTTFAGLGGSFQLGLGVVPPVWTLSVEVAFYLVLPLIAASYFRRPFVGLAIAAAIVIGWHYLSLNLTDVADVFGIEVAPATQVRFDSYYASQLPSWALSLAGGMTCAWLYVRLRSRFDPRILARRASLALAFLIPALCLIFYLAGKEAVDDPNPFLGLFARQSLGLSLAFPLVIAAAMIALSLAPAAAQWPATNRVVRWLADISYSIYLIHFAFIWLILNQFSLPTGDLGAALVWSAIVFPASILYAWLSTKLFERPIRRWARRYTVSRDQAAATSG